MVCTGNVCRSPMAAALLSHHLASAGVPASVSSAGLLEGGAPVTPGAVAAMRLRGIDVSSHRSQQIDVAMLADADLVIGMASEHVRESATLLPSTWPRTFTLRQLVRRAQEVGARAGPEDLEDWLARLHEGRDTLELIGSSVADDIADPMGMSNRAFRAIASELDGLLVQLVDLAWGGLLPSSGTSEPCLAPRSTAHPVLDTPP